MRRSLIPGWDFFERRADPSFAIDTSSEGLADISVVSLTALKSPAWLGKSGAGEVEGLLRTPSLPRRARRLARVGALSSSSAILA
jgi:hypothetical protein